MEKILFIYNRYAGKAKIKNELATILDILTQDGCEVTVYPTQSSKDAVDRVKNMASTFDCVICAGGDGTLDEVVTGMMMRDEDLRVPIGYIPAGSTNDFSKSLGIPQTIEEATREIINRNLYPCDIGSFNNDYFVYIAAFGIFTDVSYETSQELKNSLGHTAYLLEGMKKLSSIKSYKAKIICDNCIIEDDFIFGMITNSKSVGGFKNIIKQEVVMNDGVFEAVFVKKPKNIIELNELITNFISDKDMSKYIYTFKTNNIKIESDIEIPWTLDGEFGGNHKTSIIQNKHKALNFVI